MNNSFTEEKNSALNVSQESLIHSLENLLGLEYAIQISPRLDIILAKLEENDDDHWVKREWNMLAVTIDRLFIYLFAAFLVFELIYCGIHMMHIS